MNGGYLAELQTAKHDTDINQYLHKDRYYWIGLVRSTRRGFIWLESGKRANSSIWWQHKMEPDGSGDCVIKDSWRQDNPKQFGWADSDCRLDKYLGRGIYGLC